MKNPWPGFSVAAQGVVACRLKGINWPQAHSIPMPSWLVPTLVTGGITLLTGALGAIWREIKASEVRQQKALQAVQSTLQAMETRQREDMRELRAKVDRLMEGPAAAKN